MSDAFLQSYGGQSTDELLALEGKYRIDSLVLAFEQAIERKAAPSEQERVVLAVEAMEREVNNGGFSQFFVNLSVAFAPILEGSLRAIGCPKTADIARDAVKAMDPDGTLDTDALSRAAGNPDAEVAGALEACDARYFANDEPIADALFRWIKANRAAIVVGGA